MQVSREGCVYDRSFFFAKPVFPKVALPGDTLINFGESVEIVPQFSPLKQYDFVWSPADWLDCADCPEMVTVPAGKFMMGSPATEEQRFPNEGPQRSVSIPKPLALGRFEVTRAEFARFVLEAGHAMRPGCTIGRQVPPTPPMVPCSRFSSSWSDSRWRSSLACSTEFSTLLAASAVFEAM